MSINEAKIDPGSDGTMNPFPTLVKNNTGMALVEVDGQAVVTAPNLSKGLGYKDGKSVQRIFTRNKASFRDFGVLDLSRVSQFDHPCSLLQKADTALVRIQTEGRPDGNGGGGLQEVRVFTKRGALKICMKSNQPKAVQVQEMLLDLYEQVESGQLVGLERFSRVLETMIRELSAIRQELAHLKAQPPIAINLPDDTALPMALEPMALERKRSRSIAFRGGFRFPEVRGMVLDLRKKSFPYDEIADAVKEEWPDSPDRHVSKSSVQRFWAKARTGNLKEFGIDVTIH